MSVLAKIVGGTDNYDEVKFPGTDTTIRIRLLCEYEEQNAAIDAEQFVENKKISIAFHNIDIYNDEVDLRKLYQACVTPIGDRLTDTFDEFKQLLNRTQRDELVLMYQNLVERCNPSPNRMTDDEFSAVVEMVKKKPEEIVGNISSLSTLRQLAITLAKELCS